jgi:tetratricopeptide (TPR) repeat protein
MRYREPSLPASPSAGLWEIALSGSPATRGRAVGLLANPLDFRIESEMLDQLDTLLPQEWARFLLLRSMSANLLSLPQYIPLEDQQEIYAAATAYDDPHAYLAPPYPRILSYHALHDVSQMLIDNPLIVPNTFACTGVISLPDYSAESGGHLLLARNFDFEGGESFARQKSLTYIIPPPGEGIPFAHVAWPGLAGCVTGINQERIALFINAAATSDFARIGTPTILMTRQILQHARSLDDAEKIIRQTPVFVSDIIVVADGKTGTARVFEKSPAKTDAYNVQSSAAVANHLTTPTFATDKTNQSRINDSTTLQRLTRARELLDRLHHHVTPDALASLLRDKKGPNDTDLGFGNRNAIDGLIACHSVIIDATSGHLWVAGYPNAEGAFLGIDILAMLDHAPDRPDFHADASPPIIPPDNIMTDGTWQRIQDARAAAEAAADALKRHDAQAAMANADRAIAANPNFYLGHELKGRALLQSGRRDLAKSELQQALAADPPYASRRAALKELITQCDQP